MTNDLAPAPVPALAPLAPLVGTWHMVATVDGQPLGGTATTTFAWATDGAFLVQHADAEPDESWPEEWVTNAPFPVTTIIGADDALGTFHQLYADARGVHRVYRTAVEGAVWRVWRDAPEFFQRFEATISDDGATIAGRWEKSPDGVVWSVDFEVTYTRVD